MKHTAKAAVERPRFKCKYCPYTTVKFWTDGKGKHHSGIGRLRHHIEISHPEVDDRLVEDRIIAAGYDADQLKQDLLDAAEEDGM